MDEQERFTNGNLSRELELAPVVGGLIIRLAELEGEQS